jgi:acyl transferase domain-containing protein
MKFAIIGIGNKFPLSDTPDEFYLNLKNKKNLIREIDRWNNDFYYDKDSKIPGKKNKLFYNLI